MEYALKDILEGLCGKTYIGPDGGKYILFGKLPLLEDNPKLKFKNLSTGELEEFDLDQIAHFYRNSSELEKNI